MRDSAQNFLSPVNHHGISAVSSHDALLPGDGHNNGGVDNPSSSAKLSNILLNFTVQLTQQKVMATTFSLELDFLRVLMNLELLQVGFLKLRTVLSGTAYPNSLENFLTAPSFLFSLAHLPTLLLMLSMRIRTISRYYVQCCSCAR